MRSRGRDRGAVGSDAGDIMRPDGGSVRHLQLAALPLLLIPAAAQETVTMHTNGTGMYCRGCHFMLEAVHEHFIETRDRWQEKGFTIRVADFLTKHCEQSSTRGDEERITKACKHLLFYSGVIGRRHFGGNEQPTDENLYVRTTHACIDELGMCYPPDKPPVELTSSKTSRCAAIATIVHDMHDVYNRRDAKHPGFQAAAFARSVVYSACPRLRRRFPLGVALGALEKVCDDLADEHEQALVELLVNHDSSSGASEAADLRELEKRTRCPDLSSTSPWHSPWATWSAVGDARQAIEDGHIEPSELVTRLSQMPEAQLGPYSLDPEGRGGPAAADAEGRGSGGAKKKKKKKKATKRKEEL